MTVSGRRSVSRRGFLIAGACLGIPALRLGAGAAPLYPSRLIRYVVPYPPGATNDNSARIIARELSDRLSEPVVIENRAGGGGTLAAEYVAKAAPDGYTLLNASSGNLSTSPQLLRTAFDPFRDLVPVGYVGASRSVIAIHPAVPATTLAELIAFARRNPGKLNFGSAGHGSAGHIAGEYLKIRAGIDMVHVPYRGSAPAASDLVAGLIQVFIDPLTATFVRAGKARGLAFYGISTSEDLPGVPPIGEAGFPDWELSSFFFTSAPAGTPSDVVAILNGALREIAADPQATAALRALGLDPRPLRPGAIAQLLRDEYEVNRRIIEAAKIKAA
jgi:tripartite-type tricarboxylate transporter receptor subunit TctC